MFGFTQILGRVPILNMDLSSHQDNSGAVDIIIESIEIYLYWLSQGSSISFKYRNLVTNSEDSFVTGRN